MPVTTINAHALSHIPAAVKALLASGWTVAQAPDDGRLARNGQLLKLRSTDGDRSIRLFVYKVTGSSRSRPDERRIEITTTYQKGLKRRLRYTDVVLGLDDAENIFVGVDPRRIAEGGPTGNASSFFDRDGLKWSRTDEILIRPRAAKLFHGGVEYHAFIKPSRLAEYLFNTEAIHQNAYRGGGAFSGDLPAPSSPTMNATVATGETLILEGPDLKRRKRTVSDSTVAAYEKGDATALRKKKLSPEDFLALKSRMEENGRLGEEYVLEVERRRLRKAGKAALADKVRWVSQESVCEGYDILSFETAGEERWIEVKATSGTSYVFEMSDYEWRTAVAAGDSYYIYRVTNVRQKPKHKVARNPKALEDRGKVKKTATGWRVTLS